jgi:RHS repeat-associated protein
VARISRCTSRAANRRPEYITTVESTSVTTYTYDAANRLTSAGGVAYTWDDRGNLTNDGAFTYTYNAAGRLVRAESVTVTLVYTYNADGLRAAQSVDGDETTFAWDMTLGLAQVLATSDGALDLYGLGRIAEVRGGEWAYVLPDGLGSVRQWADDAGDVTYAGGYTPYGEGLWQAGSTESAWGYTGEWWDADTELLYLRARWYDSGVGRFTRKDPLTSVLNRNGTYNAYAYVGQNPINEIDPSGYYSFEEIGISIWAPNLLGIAMSFARDYEEVPYLGGRWGFLRLLQEAKDGDTLGWVSVPGWVPSRPKEFLEPKYVRKGSLYIFGGCGPITVDGLPLLFWLFDNFDPKENWEIYHPYLTRPLVQAYYLDTSDQYRRYYRDKSDQFQGLPDYASIIVGAGEVIDTQAAYTVDRYGNAYLTLPFYPFSEEWTYSIGIGVGLSPFLLPISVGYTESNFELPKGGDDGIIEEEVLKELIPGTSLAVAVEFGFFQFGGEFSWGDTLCVVSTAGTTTNVLGVQGGLARTISLPEERSLNPDGWTWVDELPLYGPDDIDWDE